MLTAENLLLTVGKKISHGREGINEGADLKMGGVLTYKLGSCFPILRLPMLRPTHVNAPSGGSAPQGCKS